MKKTLIDVSKKTGYSISTISRVLNGKSEKYRISQSAKEVILQSVKELDYQLISLHKVCAITRHIL